MSISPIKKSRISDQVFEQLKNNLIEGTWKPGEKIPSENELAAAFGVSRVTARQALSRLATLGLIETRLGEGSFVREVRPGMLLKDMIPSVYLNYDFSREAVLEVLEFRLLYEVEAAGLAAGRITDAQIAELKTYLDKMKVSGVTNIDAYTEADLAFHGVIAEATGNSLVIQLNMTMNDILRSTITNLTTKIGVANGLRYHALIIKACEEHDAETAKKEMENHLRRTYENYKKSSKN